MLVFSGEFRIKGRQTVCILPRSGIDRIRVNFSSLLHYNATRQPRPAARSNEGEGFGREKLLLSRIVLAIFSPAPGKKQLPGVFEIVLSTDLGELLDRTLQILN